MRGLLHLFAIVLVPLGLACATPVQVAFDGRQDFARYRTWDWAPGSAYDIDAPLGDVDSLQIRAASVIETELRKRGFEYARGHRADFFVAYRLVIRSERVLVKTPGAARTVNGFHGAAYSVQSDSTEERTYERAHLVIGFAGPDGRLIWVGWMEHRVPRSFDPHLERSLASVLTSFPPPSPPAGRGPAHPPVFPEGSSRLAAMFRGIGTSADPGFAIDDLHHDLDAPGGSESLAN